MSDETAPFAEHPSDEERAHWMVRRAAIARVTLLEIEKELDAHVDRIVANNEHRAEFRKEQLGLLRRFFRDQTRPIRSAWIIYKVECTADLPESIVHVLRSRMTPDKALEAACLIYEANELSTTAKFLCSKRNSAKPYPIREWCKNVGRPKSKWPGEYRIGENPTYVLRRCKTVRCSKGFDPDGPLEWEPAIPPENFGTL